MIRQTCSKILLCLACALVLHQNRANAQQKAIVLKAGRLLDVRAGKYILNQGVLIENDRIKEVGPFPKVQSDAPSEAITIDLALPLFCPG